jgi:hypothetical protein
MNDQLDTDTKDLDWMAGRQPQRIGSEPFVAGDPFARERARQALDFHIAGDGGGRGFGWRRFLGLRTVSLAAGAVAAALVAVLLVSSGGGSGTKTAATGHGGVAAPHGAAAAHAHAAHGPAAHASSQGPLMKLADYVSEAPAPSGNATLVQRTTTLESEPAVVYDLYTDDGRYFFAESKGELAGEIEAGQNTAGGWTARQLAAAEEADSGDVAAAAEDMASAARPQEPSRPGTPYYPNRLWEESQQTLIAGAGRPQIRAGVLKLLGTLPGVMVTKGTAAGAPTLVLTAGAEEMGPNYQEQLTIDAGTGVPIKFTGGVPGGPPATTVEYQVSRETFAGLEAPSATE